MENTSSKSYDVHIVDIDNEVWEITARAQAYMMWWLDASFVVQEIEKAYEFSKYAHRNDVRLSWEPYIAHPVAATRILLSLSPDIATIQACLLHDVIEDTSYEY